MRIRLSTLLVTALLLFSGPASADYPKVRVETTAGNFVIELDGSRAPLSVENFLQYVSDGYYEGTIFHRVVNSFVIQGGGFTPTLAPKPTRAGVANESGNGLSNIRMTVAMARTGEPHSGDSQFYVNLADNVGLDPKPTRWGYAVFGTVVEGIDVVDDIGSRATETRGQMSNVPAAPIIIEKMVLISGSAD